MAKLKRKLGLFGATNVGLGATIGAGIFILSGIASGIAGPAVIISFMVAGIAVFFTAMSTAELSSFITEAGGSYIFTQKAFGKFWGYFVGWMQSFDYIVGASAVSIGFAAYLAYFLDTPMTQGEMILVGAGVPLLLTLINLRSVTEASETNSFFVVLKVIALITFILIGTNYLLNTGDMSNYRPFFPNGIEGMLSGASIVFFAYVGFNTIAVIAEEVNEPKKTLPKAIFLSFGISILLYIGVIAITIGLVNWRVLGTSDAPIELALLTIKSSPSVLYFVSLSALFAITSVILSSILGGSRMIFAMARENILPDTLARVSKKGVPFVAVLLNGLAISLIVIVVKADLRWLASVFNFGTLLTYVFINWSALKLRNKMPEVERHFQVPLFPLPPILGILTCTGLMFYLNHTAILFATIWLSLGLLIYIYSDKIKPYIQNMKEK